MRGPGWRDRAEHNVPAHRYGFILISVVWLVLAICAPLHAEDASPPVEMPLIRTDGPGETVASFAHLRDAMEKAVAAYRAAPTHAGVAKIDLILSNLRSLISLEEVPGANRQRVGNATVLALLDTFGRVPLPEAGELPPGDSFDEAEIAAVRLSGTPMRIVRIDEGPRGGEWLFEEQSVTAAPRFLAGIADQPLRSSLGIDSWTAALPQLTGPLVPERLAAAIPQRLQTVWQGLPLWKIALLTGVAILSVWALNWADRWLYDLSCRLGGGGRLRILTPVLGLLILQLLLPSLARQLLPFSQMPDPIAFAGTLLSYAALAWLFWGLVQALIRLRIGRGRGMAGTIDRDLLRLIGVGLGGIGVIVIATTGAQRLGIPVVSLAAGLGIGGLAVALAIRPTLENLVGGLLLYLDRPVHIGDFCTFGEKSGTVERIGVRAVWVRGLDRTLISIPNARFVDMELINWAACDMMLIHRVLRLRFETSVDQMRFVLAEIRRMLHAHPRIDDPTIRIRYLGPSETGRDIDLRFYAQTREWNEFFAIREDTFLRIDEILEQAGARLAVPARVLHVARDTGGTDPATQLRAEESVAAWRRSGRLPFPKFAEEELAGLDDTLDYPPAGSPDAGTHVPYGAATPENLSQSPVETPEKK